MPLDAESEALLAARRRSGIRGVTTLPLAEVRESRRIWRQSSPDPKLPVFEIFDRQVEVVGGAIPVRIYRPGPEPGLPAILYMHGGGWVLGDLEHSDPLCRRLARDTGCVVVNVDYRLAPEYRYPTAAEDSYAALLWVAAQAAELGIDPARLAVAGASAGGNLAAVLGLMARDRGGPGLLAQLLIYPVLDDACTGGSYDEFNEGYIVSTEEMLWYWGQYLALAERGEDPYACPLKARDLAGLPPALVLTAECDPVRDDGERYAERLAAAGTPARYSCYRGTLHGFFSMPALLPKAVAACREAADFLRTQLHGTGPA